MVLAVFIGVVLQQGEEMDDVTIPTWIKLTFGTSWMLISVPLIFSGARDFLAKKSGAWGEVVTGAALALVSGFIFTN